MTEGEAETFRRPGVRNGIWLMGAEGGHPLGERFPCLTLRFARNGPLEDFYQKLDDMRFNPLAFG